MFAGLLVYVHAPKCMRVGMYVCRQAGRRAGKQVQAFAFMYLMQNDALPRGLSHAGAQVAEHDAGHHRTAKEGLVQNPLGPQPPENEDFRRFVCALWRLDA